MPACLHPFCSAQKPYVPMALCLHSAIFRLLFNMFRLQVVYAIRVRTSFSASQDIVPFVMSAVCVLLIAACAVAANKMQLGTRALQVTSACVVVCASAPMLVHWGARGESGGGLQLIMPLRMIVFVLATSVDWMPGAVCLVAAVLVAAVAVALKCACTDGSMLVLSACIVCAAVLAERWLWCGVVIAVLFLNQLLVCIAPQTAVQYVHQELQGALHLVRKPGC
jgi:hypothetical protein